MTNLFSRALATWISEHLPAGREVGINYGSHESVEAAAAEGKLAHFPKGETVDDGTYPCELALEVGFAFLQAPEGVVRLPVPAWVRPDAGCEQVLFSAWMFEGEALAAASAYATELAKLQGLDAVSVYKTVGSAVRLEGEDYV